MLDDAGTLLFFVSIQEFIREYMQHKLSGALDRMFSFIGLFANILLTFWVGLRGYRIMTGQSKENMTVFIVEAGKAVLIVNIATGFALFGSSINDALDFFQHEITYIFVGERNKTVYDLIDRNLQQVQGILIGLQALGNATDSGDLRGMFSNIMWSSGIGIVGPAIIGGLVCLLSEIGLMLAKMFAPLFILALLFEQTKQMFWHWLKYCVGILCMFGLLAVMTELALEVTYQYAKVILGAGLLDLVLTKYVPGAAGLISVPSIAESCMLLGGLGLLFSMLIITVPPMIMHFFSVSLGTTFSHYSPFNDKKGMSQHPGESVGKSNAGSVQRDNKEKVENHIPESKDRDSSAGSLAGKYLGAEASSSNQTQQNSSILGHARSVSQENSYNSVHDKTAGQVVSSIRENSVDLNKKSGKV